MILFLKFLLQYAIFCINNSLCIFSGGTGSKAKNEIAAGKNILFVFVGIISIYRVYHQNWECLEACIFSAKLLSVSKGKCLCWFYFKLSKFFSKLQFLIMWVWNQCFLLSYLLLKVFDFVTFQVKLLLLSKHLCFVSPCTVLLVFLANSDANEIRKFLKILWMSYLPYLCYQFGRLHFIPNFSKNFKIFDLSFVICVIRNSKCSAFTSSKWSGVHWGKTTHCTHDLLFKCMFKPACNSGVITAWSEPIYGYRRFQLVVFLLLAARQPDLVARI